MRGEKDDKFPLRAHWQSGSGDNHLCWTPQDHLGVRADRTIRLTDLVTLITLGV
jgi:hypothetical protein